MKKNKNLSKLWKFLNSDVSEVISEESVKTTTESTKAFLELGKTLQEQGTKLEDLKPLLQCSSSLLDILCSPEVQLVGSALPFVPLAISLVKFSRRITHKELTLKDSVNIVSQAAYLESLKEILTSPGNQDILNIFTNVSTTNSQPIQASLQKLADFELDEETVKIAIVRFQESELAQQYNQVLITRLEQSGISASDAKIFANQVAANSNKYFTTALSQAGDEVKKLAELYQNGEIAKLEQVDSIKQYLNDKITSLPDQSVFDENFTFRDIYVPLQAVKVNENGKLDDYSNAFDLSKWAINILLDEQKGNKVLFIQGGPGRGKSVFCRMFADWARRYLFPHFTPILIRLRDIEEFQPSFKETLRNQIPYDFAQNDDGWLTDANQKFLFILDGFDELRIERSNNENIERFIRQLGSFQEDYQKRHRVIITGRAMSLYGINRLPENLEKVEVAPMSQELQDQWFFNWYQLFPNDNIWDFQKFLRNEKICPQQITELAKEPLLLYMLVAMHRDGKLDIAQFEQVEGAAGKILIYEQALDWVLTKQRTDNRHGDLNSTLTQQNPEALRRLLTEAAVAVVQSGGECASIQMVKARLQQDDEAKELLAKAEEKLGTDEAVKNTLAAFYIKSNDNGGVEFFHKSFREFLYAERIRQSLEEWTEPGRRGRNFNIDENQLHQQIYDLFGYGDGLTPEVIEYLMELLKTSSEFRPVELFQRLDDFYQRWCEGEFIESIDSSLPKDKAVKLRNQGIEIGQRVVDIYTGLNVMIVLLNLHRYAQLRDELKRQIIFYPSGQLVDARLKNQLLRIINYSDCIQLNTFGDTVGRFLSGTNLPRVYLHHANLSDADLSGADLCDADLRNTDLSDAYLLDANFSNANLSHANLSDANLTSANLLNANLCGANLFNADLSDANLSGANLTSVNLDHAYLFDADLSHAKLSHANLFNADLSGADLTSVNLSHAKLFDANLLNANLLNANLTSVNLSDANLGGANLTSVNLRHAYLISADLSSTNLSGANLTDADLTEANLTNADLTNANLTSVNLSDANLSGANLTSVNLTDANLSVANLTDANLTNADLHNANLSVANLSGANLSGANLNGANLRDVNLNGANLNGAKLINANLSNVNLTNADLTNADLTNAILRDVNLTNAQLGNNKGILNCMKLDPND